jgi:hypothetical protein
MSGVPVIPVAVKIQISEINGIFLNLAIVKNRRSV